MKQPRLFAAFFFTGGGYLYAAEITLSQSTVRKMRDQNWNHLGRKDSVKSYGVLIFRFMLKRLIRHQS
ncbi:MAG: hypothetical protein OJI67_19070, partial [Prosthecobacter sp.]|nr:hypothetical protein [Prosthecobacter sp.]